MSRKPLAQMKDDQNDDRWSTVSSVSLELDPASDEPVHSINLPKVGPDSLPGLPVTNNVNEEAVVPPTPPAKSSINAKLPRRAEGDTYRR